jgi:hypothetical protein
MVKMKKEYELVGFNFPKEKKELLNRVCEKRGETLSDFVRGTVLRELARLSFLSPEEKKALGVRGNDR